MSGKTPLSLCYHSTNMPNRLFCPKFALLSLCVFCAGALFCLPAHAQLWDMLTKPQITVNLTHPPRLGLNIKRVAFGPANGRCSDEILDRLAADLVSNGVDVMDRHSLQIALAKQHLSLTGYVDQQSAVRMGKLLGPTALIFVKVSGCHAEQKRDYSDAKNKKGEVVRTNRATLEMHIRGSLQTVDLATGRIFSASPIVDDSVLTNESTNGRPEFPSEQMMRDRAIDRAAYDASTMFVNWTEEKKLYFFNEKDCNLNLAFALLKAGDFTGTVRQSVENIATCTAWPKAKDSNLAHAYYNAGLAYLLVNDHQKAISYLTESQKMKGGEIVRQTIAEADNSARLEAEMRTVAQRTEEFEQSQADSQADSQPAPADAQGSNGSNSPSGSAEDRLKKLDSLYKKGLISKEEYEAKRKAILKDI